MSTDVELGHDFWARAEADLRVALSRLAVRIQRERPDMELRVNRSQNEVKPLDMVATLSVPSTVDDQVAISVMFTRFRGPLEYEADAMIEDAPVVAELPRRSLGTNPSDAEVGAAVAEVVAFVSQLDDAIGKALPERRFHSRPRGTDHAT